MTALTQKYEKENLLQQGLERLNLLFLDAQKNKNLPITTSDRKPDFNFINAPKNTMEVLAFLNSPGGKSIKASIMKQLSILALVKENQQFEMRQEIFKKRIMTLMLLA